MTCYWFISDLTKEERIALTLPLGRSWPRVFQALFRMFKMHRIYRISLEIWPFFPLHSAGEEESCPQMSVCRAGSALQDQGLYRIHRSVYSWAPSTGPSSFNKPNSYWAFRYQAQNLSICTFVRNLIKILKIIPINCLNLGPNPLFQPSGKMKLSF